MAHLRRTVMQKKYKEVKKVKNLREREKKNAFQPVAARDPNYNMNMTNESFIIHKY